MLDAAMLFNYLVFCGMVPGLLPQHAYGHALLSDVEGHQQCHRAQHHKGDQSACWPHRVQLWRRTDANKPESHKEGHIESQVILHNRQYSECHHGQQREWTS